MDRLSLEKGLVKVTGRLRTLLPGVLAVALAAACAAGPSEFPAADFTLKSPLTGRETAFASFKGRPVIIYWFTSW